MRVVRSSVYRRYTSSLNDLQSNLNKSMNKVSTGAAYETAADNWNSTVSRSTTPPKAAV